MLGFIILLLGVPALIFAFLSRINRIPPDPYIQGRQKFHQHYRASYKGEYYFSPYPEGSAENDLWWDGYKRAGDEIVALY